MAGHTTKVEPGDPCVEPLETGGLAERDTPRLDGSRDALDLGVFNRHRHPDEPVREGDRIEVYRPLAIDPKQARRIRAEIRRRRKG
ncbi:MAG: RnfH family protein [Anaerolineae bacterium]|nr:RnfH family protein [Anaerolineae bacterium]